MEEDEDKDVGMKSDKDKGDKDKGDAGPRGDARTKKGAMRDHG